MFDDFSVQLYFYFSYNFSVLIWEKRVWCLGFGIFIYPQVSGYGTGWMDGVTRNYVQSKHDGGNAKKLKPRSTFVQLNVTYLAMPCPEKGNLSSACRTGDANTTLQFQDGDSVMPKT
jgi:hypothetical protein